MSSFKGKNGWLPWSGMALGPNGVLYGTTWLGGGDYPLRLGNGFVFALTPSANGWNYGILHDFQPGPLSSDGSHPKSTPMLDAHGNLYGTTFNGGTNGAGTVYMVTP